jgi:hypothetical protein
MSPVTRPQAYTQILPWFDPQKPNKTIEKIAWKEKFAKKAGPKTHCQNNPRSRLEAENQQPIAIRINLRVFCITIDNMFYQGFIISVNSIPDRKSSEYLLL